MCLHVVYSQGDCHFNTVFAKRRVKQSPEMVMQHINNTDLDGLPGEHCELLLQIIPQENEVKLAATLSLSSVFPFTFPITLAHLHVMSIFSSV